MAKREIRGLQLAMLALAAGSACTAFGQPCISGAFAGWYSGGGSNTGVAAADLNGDGSTDVVVASHSGGALHTRFNLGDGAMGSESVYALPGFQVNLFGVCTGDIDGDGLPEVVACAYNSNLIAVLWNNGDGSFAAPTMIAQSGGPAIPILADVDGDGDLDLVVTNYYTARVSVRMNTGGTFGPALQYGVGNGPWGVRAGDLDGDGAVDLVTANNAGTISVLLNNGDGTFAAAATYPASFETIYVALADLDGDRDLDIATSNYVAQVGPAGSVTTYLNDGAGLFGNRRDITGGFNAPLGIAAIDYDGDGDQDLAVSNYHANDIDLLVNDGAGDFPTRFEVIGTAGWRHYEMVAADFRGLGRDELASAMVSGGVRLWGGSCEGVDPISVYTCPSGAASFDVRPLDTAATYQWERLEQGGTWSALSDGVLVREDGNVLVAGADTPRLELVLDLAPGASGGSYRCVMSDAEGTLVSAPGLLRTTLACPTLEDASDRAIPMVSGQQWAAPGSTATYLFAGLVIDEGGYFELGSGETLNLSNGRGTLFIMPGAVFVANGVVYGHIFNQGLLRLQITPTGWIGLVQGGVVSLTPAELPSPVDPIIEISPEESPSIPPETMLVVGPGGSGSAPGGGGGGGSGGGSFAGAGGTYRVNAPSFSQGGHLSFDATLEVTGSFTQTETGVLRMFIAGDQPGETFNQFLIGETATIDGAVQIVLDPLMFGFTPSVGESFDMVIADGGITLAPGLELKTMMTAAGAQAMGLSLTSYVSPFLMDPDELVEFPASLFDVALVNSGTTLRFTMNQAVCAAQTLATTAPACGRDTAEFMVRNPGSGPLAYQWQIEDAPGSETWTDLSAGFYDGLGTVLTPTERTMGIRKPRFFASGTRFRCVVSGPCATVMSEPVALSVLDQTEEACGNCPICEADFDDNGGVDGGDLAAFFTAFEEGVLCADVDRNGGVDGGDLATFFQLFEDGGCE